MDTPTCTALNWKSIITVSINLSISNKSQAFFFHNSFIKMSHACTFCFFCHKLQFCASTPLFFLNESLFHHFFQDAKIIVIKLISTYFGSNLLLKYFQISLITIILASWRKVIHWEKKKRMETQNCSLWQKKQTLRHRIHLCVYETITSSN